MTQGQVYVWEPCESEFTGGTVRAMMVPLLHLTPAASTRTGLNGRYVEVVNAGRINEPDSAASGFLSVAIGGAKPDASGNYVYQPATGGGRLNKQGPPKPLDRAQYIEASHFGEVNTYYHITRIAERVDTLLARLGEKPLPKVRALVNAHSVATQPSNWRDAVPDREGVKWVPVRGGHYRLPTRRNADLGGRRDAYRSGEIHLGPGLWLTREGWLARIARSAYSTNASHNAGLIYRQYGHHIARHTADFRANALRPPHRQSNVKTMTDSAVSDYWAATMLGTPHIMCWHRRHDVQSIHRRSLVAQVTMTDFDSASDAKPHRNGTILAAALWDLRELLKPQGDSICDLLVLSALLSARRLRNDPYRPDINEARALRHGFSVFAACLLHADAMRFDGKHSDSIVVAMKGRGIDFCDKTRRRLAQRSVPTLAFSLTKTPAVREHVDKIRARFPEAIIPGDNDLLHPDDLESRLCGVRNAHYDLATVGDVMTGMRMRHRISRYGQDYAFAWVRPVLQRTAVVVGNLEGPFAESARQESTTRNFSYKVNPKSAASLRRAGFSAMTIANNHLLDCGREGVRETLETLAGQGIKAIGGGLDEASAHKAAIFETRGGRIGLLGYYWNRRTAADGDLPGSARDLPELVERDIERLKRRVDRVAVMVHWGVPYRRQPLAEDRMKAHHFIDCGADIVIGHHPHIIQPLEVYRGRPIFFSIGNFAFGSGNSRAESLLLCFRFLGDLIEVDILPVYVQNRDPRLNYQPKVMCGKAALQTLRRLALISGEDGKLLELGGFCARLRLTASQTYSRTSASA